MNDILNDQNEEPTVNELSANKKSLVPLEIDMTEVNTDGW